MVKIGSFTRTGAKRRFLFFSGKTGDSGRPDGNFFPLGLLSALTSLHWSSFCQNHPHLVLQSGLSLLASFLHVLPHQFKPNKNPPSNFLQNSTLANRTSELLVTFTFWRKWRFMIALFSQPKVLSDTISRRNIFRTFIAIDFHFLRDRKVTITELDYMLSFQGFSSFLFPPPVRWSTFCL